MADVLVVGGTGFIGEYVVRALAGMNVAVADSSTPRANLEVLIEKTPRIMWLAPPTGLLWELSVPVSSGLQLERFVLASSLLLYNESDVAQTENALLAPQGAYEHAKAKDEEIVKEIFRQHPEKLIIARLANVYGDVKNKGVVDRIFRVLRDGGVFTRIGDGSQRRDFIHVEDASRILAGLISAEGANGIYNVSTGQSTSLSEMISKAERITGKRLKIVQGQNMVTKKCIVCDNSKVLRLLKMRVRETIDSGLEKTYRRYFANGVSRFS